MIPEVVKIGQNLSPASAEQFGLNQGQSQQSLTQPVLFQVGTAAISYPVVGVALTAVMLKIMALPGEAAGKISNIILKMKENYDKEYSNAVTKRAKAQTKLYTDLVAKKEKLIKESKTASENIEKLKKDIKEQTKQKDKEYAKYQVVIFDYASKAKELENAGKTEESKVYVDKIKELDYWFGEITLMMTNIINLKLELKYAEKAYADMQELINTEIPNDWDKDCDLSTDFEVAIPYYPDLPAQPQYPAIPNIPSIPPQIRTLMIQMAKWMACPLIMPIGVSISATLLMIKEKSPNAPSVSAKLDSQIDAMIPSMAGGF